jgi:hypothetical protein
LRELEHDTSITVRLADGSTAGARVSQVQSLLLEEAIRLLWRMRAFDVSEDEAVSQAIREFEESRREIAARIRSLKNASRPSPCPRVLACV